MTLNRFISCAMLFAVTTMLVAQGIALPFSRLDILFAGDLMQHQSQLDAALQVDGHYSYSACYRHIRGTVSAADIAVANLETTIGTANYGGYPSFCAPDSFLHAAKDAGFDVMLFANNHCLDRGKRGALYTLDKMDTLGIMHCGVYRDSTDRANRYPLMVEKRGIRIAILNYTYGTNGIEPPAPIVVNYIDKKQIAIDIDKAKTLNADVIIACMHWGSEYVSIPPKNIRAMADWLLSQGVTHVIGGHPHVLQPMELRQANYMSSNNAVVYSLGNLLSGMYLRGRDGGALVNLELHKLYDTTYLRSLSYMLTWVARPQRDNVDNFVILKAAAPPQGLADGAYKKLSEFVSDSRLLFQKHNKGHIIELTR